MKIIKYISAVLPACIGMIILVSGCKKAPMPTYTTDDAAAAVSSAISNTGGMSAELRGAASFTSYLQSPQCNAALDTDINNIYTISGENFYYHAPWTYTAKCSGGATLLVTIAGSYSYHCNANTCTSFTGARNWTVTGLGNNSSPYSFNGTYTRKGAQQFSSGSEAPNTSNITVTIANVTIDKSTNQITGGAGTVAINVAFDNNNSYMNLTGNIVFNGNGTATLTLLSAPHTYNITL